LATAALAILSQHAIPRLRRQERLQVARFGDIIVLPAAGHGNCFQEAFAL